MKPKLTEEASAVIAEEYSKLRSEDVVESDVARVRFKERNKKKKKNSLQRKRMKDDETCI